MNYVLLTILMFFVSYRIAFWWTVRHQFSGSGLRINKEFKYANKQLKKTVLFVLCTDIRFFIKTNPIKTTDRLILHNDMPDLKTILLSALLTMGIAPLQAQTVHGRIVDEHSKPVKYANVVALNPADYAQKA